MKNGNYFSYLWVPLAFFSLSQKKKKKASRISSADAAGVFRLTRETFKAGGNLKAKIKLVSFSSLRFPIFTQTIFWKHGLVASN